MKLKTILALGCLVLVSVLTSQSAIIADWTFESGAGNPPLGTGSDISGIMPEVGLGIASGHHASTSTAWSNPEGAGSVESFSSTRWAIGDYYQFASSTVGYNNISISFKAASSNTGPKDFKVAYSTDGSSFTDFITYSVLANAAPNPLWNAGMNSGDAAQYSYSFNMAVATALNNQTTIFLRLIDRTAISANGGVVATGGTSRVDDFAINGDTLVPVPEPSTYLAGLLLALPFGVHGVRYLRNRKRA